jgi:ABC-2 type transport system permease protein/lipopolysaccharide transport system permease protein
MDVGIGAKVPHAEYFPPPPSTRGPSRWLSVLDIDSRELVRYWPVVQNMVIQELRVRYQRSILGFFWTLLHPILMMTTLSLVFSKLLKAANPATYAVYLFAGLVPWGFLSSSLNECAFCIISNENLIKKIYLPKLVFPLAKVLTNLTTCLLSMVALFLLMLPLGARFSVSLLALPLATALLFAFTLGLSLIVATANTFYRDCGHLVSVVLQAWYFLTPIIYKVDLLKPEEQWKFWLNPAYPFFQMFQAIISDGIWPPLTICCVAAGIAASSLGIGYAAFKSQEDKLVFRL